MWPLFGLLWPSGLCLAERLGQRAVRPERKAMFRENKRPEGYVFPACAPCNSGSRVADNWAGFLSMMDPNVDWTPDEAQKNVKRLLSLDAQHPGLIKEILGGSVAEKRALARRLKIERTEGQTFPSTYQSSRFPKKPTTGLLYSHPNLRKLSTSNILNSYRHRLQG
jgi:hypothetical protein